MAPWPASVDERGEADTEGRDFSALLRAEEGVEGTAGKGMEGGEEGGVEADNGRVPLMVCTRSLFDVSSSLLLGASLEGDARSMNIGT